MSPGGREGWQQRGGGWGCCAPRVRPACRCRRPSTIQSSARRRGHRPEGRAMQLRARLDQSHGAGKPRAPGCACVHSPVAYGGRPGKQVGQECWVKLLGRLGAQQAASEMEATR